MAEGPVVHYYSRMLAKALTGRQVDIELGVRKLKAVEPSLRGVRITDVSPHGKQFRIRFSDGRILLVHLMMWGSWRIYRQGPESQTEGSGWKSVYGRKHGGFIRPAFLIDEKGKIAGARYTISLEDSVSWAITLLIQHLIL